MYGMDQFENELKELRIVLSDVQKQQFEEYYKLLVEWNEVMNLTAITDYKDVMKKHFFDSLTVVRAYPEIMTENVSVIDIGTGAGFPGIPLAILRPDMQVVLVDSVLKKLVFIENAAAKLGIKNIKILHIRAEEGGRRRKTRETFDMVTARAAKMLPIIAEWGVPFVKEGGIFAAMKGPGADEELRQSGKILKELKAELMERKELELPTGERRTILYFRKTAPSPKTYPRKVGVAEKKPIIGEA